SSEAPPSSAATERAKERAGELGWRMRGEAFVCGREGLPCTIIMCLGSAIRLLAGQGAAPLEQAAFNLAQCACSGSWLRHRFCENRLPLFHTMLWTCGHSDRPDADMPTPNLTVSNAMISS